MSTCPMCNGTGIAPVVIENPEFDMWIEVDDQEPADSSSGGVS